MIEFNGIISEKCNSDRRNRVNKLTLLLFSICFLAGVVTTVILGVLHKSEFITILVCTVVLGIVTVLTALPLSKNRIEQIKKYTAVNTRITIENGIISFYNPISYISKPITKVKKVLDMGEWYYIIFKFGDISNSWICQKDLITKGTIEDFEKIFEGKIKRDKSINI